MSIAEKLLQLKQDFDNVYKAGQEAGGGGDIIDLARYAKTFYFGTDVGLPENLVVNLDTTTSLANFITGINFLTVKHLTINCPNQITSMNRTFYGQTNLYTIGMEHITLNFDTSKNTSYRQAFVVMPNLKTIDGTPLDFSSATDVTQLFANCPVLEEVWVAKETIKINMDISSVTTLSVDSLLSFLYGLYDYSTDVSSTSHTFKIGTANLNKLTDTQKAIATEKGWSLT